MSTLKDKTAQTTNQHVEFLSYTLGVFDKNFDTVTTLFADSCSTNRSVVTKLRKPLIGCSSNRFQLVVREIISDVGDVIKRRYSLMARLWTPLLRANLYEKTLLRANLSNDTRWTSVCVVLKRHVVLSSFVCKLNDVDVDIALLPVSFERRIGALFTNLEEFNDVFLRLQLH